MYVVLIIDDYTKKIISNRYYNTLSETLDVFREKTKFIHLSTADQLIERLYVYDTFGNNKYAIFFELENLNKLIIQHRKLYFYVNMFKRSYNIKQILL
jgi:hypothetical protein